MKQNSWLLVGISVLLFVGAACAPLAPARVEIIITPTGGATEAETAAMPAEAEAETPAETTVEAPAEAEPAAEEATAEPAAEEATAEPTAEEVAVEATAEPTAEPTEEEAEAALVEPAITSPRPDSELSSRELNLAGTGEPGSEVQAIVDGQIAGTTTIDSDGNWSLEISLEEPGDYEISIQVLDAAGDVAAETEPLSVSATFETAAEVEPPTIIFPADGADIILGELTLIGSGDPGTEVEVLDNEDLLEVVEVEAGGEWTFRFEPSEGDHQLSARVPEGEAVSAGVIDIQVFSPDDGYDCDSNPGLVREDSYIVGTCDTLVSISEQLGIEYEDLAAANPQIGEPDLIYPGEELAIPQ